MLFGKQPRKSQLIFSSKFEFFASLLELLPDQRETLRRNGAVSRPPSRPALRALGHRASEKEIRSSQLHVYDP